MSPASWITEDYLARQANDPELTDAEVLQLHGCVWAATSSTWIPPDIWNARADLQRVIEPGEPIVLGFDGSARRDTTAIVAATLDGFITPVRVWEKPQGERDWQVPRDEVADVLERMIGGHNVVEVAADPFGWQTDVQEWAKQWEQVLEFPTNSRARMAPACDRFRADTNDGNLSHDGDRRLASHVDHCVAKITPFGTSSPRPIPTHHALVGFGPPLGSRNNEGAHGWIEGRLRPERRANLRAAVSGVAAITKADAIAAVVSASTKEKKPGKETSDAKAPIVGTRVASALKGAGSVQWRSSCSDSRRTLRYSLSFAVISPRG